jgi:hypothetical protein
MTDLERIAVNPLGKHKANNEDFEADMSAKPRGTENEEKASSKQSVREMCSTENRSPAGSHVVNKITNSVPAATTVFTIFSDEVRAASLPVKNSAEFTEVAPTGAFQIFSDSNGSDNDPKPKSRVTADIKTVHNVQQTGPLKPGNTGSAENPASFFNKIQNCSIKKAFGQQNLEPGVTSAKYTTPVREEVLVSTADISVQEDDLDDVLQEMGIIDDEDGTINTRLARKDIDSMFCSPGPASATKKIKVSATQTVKGMPVYRSSGSTELLYRMNSTYRLLPCSGSPPKVLPLKAFTNSLSQHPGPLTSRGFGGSDLSAIQETSCEFSVCGPLNVSPMGNAKSAVAKSRLSTICSSGTSDGFSIFCDLEDSPAATVRRGK